MDFSRNCFSDHLEGPKKKLRLQECFVKNRIVIDDVKDLKRRKVGGLAKTKRIYIDDLDDVDKPHNTVNHDKVISYMYTLLNYVV